MKQLLIALLTFLVFIVLTSPVLAQDNAPTTTPPQCITSGPLTPQPSCAIQVNQRDLGFRIPSLSEILTFAIRGFFIIGGLVALIFLLLGALSWITSGGDKENISKAQSKITSAIVGVILIVVVLALIVTLEQVVFARRLCLGLSCPITIPSLLKPPGSVPGADSGSLNINDQESTSSTTTTTTTTSTGVGSSTVQINRYNQNTQQNGQTNTNSVPGQEVIPNTGR